MRIVELGVAGGGALTVLPSVDDPPQLPPQRDSEVERGADPLGAERQAVAGRVAGEENPALGAAAQLVGNPVALVADAVGIQVFGEKLGGGADVKTGIEGADPDPQLVTGRERPSVAGGDVAAVDPDLQVLAFALGVDLEPARERRVGGVGALAPGQHPAPSPRGGRERGAPDAPG